MNKFFLLNRAKEKLRHRYILLVVLAIILIVKSTFYFYMLSLDVIRHLHSSIKEKIKIKALKLLQKCQDLQRLAEVFKQENCPLNIIVDNGLRFLLAIYGAHIIEFSIDNYQYLSFAKSTKLNTYTYQINYHHSHQQLQPLNSIYIAFTTNLVE